MALRFIGVELYQHGDDTHSLDAQEQLPSIYNRTTIFCSSYGSQPYDHRPQSSETIREDDTHSRDAARRRYRGRDRRLRICSGELRLFSSLRSHLNQYIQGVKSNKKDSQALAEHAGACIMDIVRELDKANDTMRKQRENDVDGLLRYMVCSRAYLVSELYWKDSHRNKRIESAASFTTPTGAVNAQTTRHGRYPGAATTAQRYNCSIWSSCVPFVLSISQLLSPTAHRSLHIYALATHSLS